ncbi:hypothetical protein CEXT_74551 [Caerostris extrusa]|uniref:Uncharacterized protein n=1 Tax=Caerostris extrusa TaxID=172846 RepID=A0AAV4T8D4_CAEEX|nr:hypothetical protein CEXT_74551 [Caerostris extrusa]
MHALLEECAVRWRWSWRMAGGSTHLYAFYEDAIVPHYGNPNWSYLGSNNDTFSSMMTQSLTQMNKNSPPSSL